MPRQSLRAWVRSSASQLESELARFKNGSEWAAVLQVDEVREAVRAEGEAGLSAQDRLQLKNALDRYNKLLIDPQYSEVTQLRGFKGLHMSLMEALAAETSSGRKRLARSALALLQSVRELSVDTDWQTYLAIPDEAVLADALLGETAQDPEVEQLKTTLTRFEQVRKENKYPQLLQMPEFQATEENLASYIRQLEKKLANEGRNQPES